MIPAQETFDGTWPFGPHFSNAAGFKQHYVDECPRDGEVIICMHVEPGVISIANSFLNWRRSSG